jgi:hypothetical protein
MNVLLPDLSSHKNSLLEVSPQSLLLEDPLTDIEVCKDWLLLHPAQVAQSLATSQFPGKNFQCHQSNILSYTETLEKVHWLSIACNLFCTI